MKKQLIVCLCLFIGLLLNAQTPAGNNQEIQFNNNGVFGASPYLTWDGANLKFLDLGSYSAKLYFRSESGDDSYIFSENWGANKNRLVFHTRDDGDDDYAVFRNRHWNDGEKDVFEIHRTWTMANSNFYVMNGNVGVGTITPNSKLEINYGGGSSTVPGMKIYGGGAVYENITLSLDDTGTASNNINILEFKNSSIRSGIIKSINPSSNNSSGGNLIIETTSNNTGFLNSNQLFLKNTGYVGIGTSVPDSKLTVAGKIHAQEVKVTINAGADFVFNSDYKLPSLKDVEKFIKANEHLPEIASEKEMQTNGLLLAEMNIKLLQKIEELTLYTINQEKKIKINKSETTSLKEELQVQKSINENLEARLQKIEALLNSKK